MCSSGRALGLCILYCALFTMYSRVGAALCVDRQYSGIYIYIGWVGEGRMWVEGRGGNREGTGGEERGGEGTGREQEERGGKERGGGLEEGGQRRGVKGRGGGVEGSVVGGGGTEDDRGENGEGWW